MFPQGSASILAQPASIIPSDLSASPLSWNKTLPGAGNLLNVLMPTELGVESSPKIRFNLSFLSMPLPARRGPRLPWQLRIPQHPLKKTFPLTSPLPFLQVRTVSHNPTYISP